MLQHSFIHLKGIGDTRETTIWHNGITTWHDFLQKRSYKYGWLKRLHPHVEESLDQYRKRNISFFYSHIPSAHRWRLYDEFKENCAFLDIETTGFLSPTDTITIAGLFDGKELKTFIQGENLDELVPELKKKSLIITYGGSCFDLPFIKHQFAVPHLCDAHIDLRYVLARLGYKGGLKHIEQQFQIHREGSLGKVDSWVAPLLWKEYKQGNSQALDVLIRYNAEDVVNLLPLMEKAYILSLKKIPFNVNYTQESRVTCTLPPYDEAFLSKFFKKLYRF